eukprot:TRINITY_DN8740_c0_g1_i4.p1 TRINITY_DN8740_c0_g1~~TRINITY_DN8740_c0_g1_i4.p1  ORF type:complete len:467 (-),score=130.41 TRINITY_DN8740_c0_g1_i4:29-1429(-)
MLAVIPSTMMRTLRTLPSPLMRHMSSPMMMTMSSSISTLQMPSFLVQRTPISNHTAYTQPMLVTNFHTSRTVNKETKTKNAEKEKEAPAMSNILEEEEHKTILKGLASDSKVPTDRMVGHILAKNIKVFKLSLENNVVVSKEGLGYISITVLHLPKNLNTQVKTGRYSAEEDSIIKLNWEKLTKDLELTEEDAVEELFKNTSNDKDLCKKRNIIGYFLSQGLTNVRLATEVYQRARTVRCAKKGDFTKEEDEAILQFVEKEGEQWTRLAIMLGRASNETVSGRYDILINDYKHGDYTAMEDELILREVFAVDSDILVDGKITQDDWNKIAEKLQRRPDNVRRHWQLQLEPILKRYQAGTLHKDVKDVMINHLLEHNMNYAQEVDWKELAKLSKFAGTTSSYLSNMYSTLRSNTGRKYPELSEVQLNTEAIRRFRANTNTRSTSHTVLEHQEMIVKFYLSHILQVSS